jgi:Lsr2
MARTVRVHLLDDIDGTTADETVKFSLDGTLYEIDLSSEHSEQLRKMVAKYIVAGRRASGGIVTGIRSRHHNGTARNSRTQNQAIREWARKTGHDINSRGRIPASLVELFEKDASR